MNSNSPWVSYMEARSKLYARWKEAVAEGDIAAARTIREQILLWDAPLIDPGEGPKLP